MGKIKKREYVIRMLGAVIDFYASGITWNILWYIIDFMVESIYLDYPPSIDLFYLPSIYLVFLVKDLWFKEGSLGKKMLRMTLRGKDGSSEATTINRIMRNATLFLLPVEVIVFFANKGRRLGDLIGGTLVKMDAGKIIKDADLPPWMK